MFLSGLFLIALPLIGVPIALHFYRGRQVDQIDWGAMPFLVDAISDGRRWEKLEELLLMLLRVAAVAALVFALARPQVRGGWLGVHDTREVVIVVDDSLSTAVTSNDKAVFSLIRESAADAVDDLTAADQVQLLAAGGGGRWLTLEPVAATAGGKRRLKEVIESLKPTEGGASLLSGLQSATTLEPIEGATERLILLVTDGQAAAFERDNSDGWTSWAKARDASLLPIATRVVDCGLGAGAPGNLAIGRVAAARSVVREGDPVKLTADVANFGFESSRPATVEWRIGEQVLATTNLKAISPGESRQAVATIELQGSGPKLVRAVITEEDDLPLDQSAPIVVEIADRLPVLIIESADDQAGRLLASHHLSATLGYIDGEPQVWRSVFEPIVVAPEELDGINLGDYRAVIVASVERLDGEDVDRLRGFVATGGGLWVTLGDGVEVEAFNALWHDDDQGLCPLPLEGLVGGEEDDEAFPAGSSRGESDGVAIHPPEPGRPATGNLANTTQLDIDKTLLSRYWRFREPDEDDSREASVLLRTGGGDPLAVERYYGRGRVIVQAFPHDLAWSNLPVRKAYVVMVQDWLDYLAAPSIDRHNLAPGSPIVAQAPSADEAASGAEVTALVVTPQGDEIDLAPRGDLASRIYRYSLTSLPGVYRVRFRAGGETISEAAYQAPRPLEESRLEPLSEEARAWLTENAGLEFGAGDTAPPTEAATEAKLAPFWWALLAALALLLVLELLLASRIAWRRLGEPSFSVS